MPRIRAVIFICVYCTTLSKMTLGQNINTGTPKIQPIILPPSVELGKSRRLTCSAEEGDKPLQFSWKFQNRNVSYVSNIVVNNFEDFSVLVIDSVSSENAGNYTCIARNSKGTDSFTASLAVLEPTKWRKEPQDVTVLEGQALSVECEAQGHPPPVITWYKLSGNGDSSEKALVSKGNSSLQIHPATIKDAGRYQCEAANGIGKSLRKEILVKIHVPARFEEKFAVVTAKKGDSSRMRCEALGDQPLAISWHRDEKVLNKNGENKYEIFETMVPKGVVSELIIRTTGREDGALYSCLAENEYGHDERKIRLLVMEVPAHPMDVKIREIWSRSASVSWSPPYSGNSPITEYIVQYWRDVGGTPHRLHELSAPSSQVSALLKDLQPGATYVLKIVAENSVGRGEPSDAISFTTGEEEPSAPPADIIAEPRGSSTIRVSWKPPPKDSWNGELKGYYVGYKVRDSVQPYSYKTTEFVPNSQQEFFLGNLLKASDYSVVVKAFNSAGSGPPSHEMYVRTLDGDLPPAPSVYVADTSPTSVSLKWSTRKIDNILSGYTVHFREDQGQWQEVAVVAPEDNAYVLTGLQPGKLYQIYITATNQYGKGDPSEIVAVKTEETERHSLLSVSSFGAPGSYTDMAVVIPVTASLLTIFVVLTVACICVKKIRSRHNLERALAAEKHLAMVGTLQRYVEIDKTRALLDPNNPGCLFPAPYETIPMTEDQEMAQAKAAVQAVQAALAKDGQQTLYNKPPPTKKKDENIYDMPE